MTITGWILYGPNQTEQYMKHQENIIQIMFTCSWPRLTRIKEQWNNASLAAPGAPALSASINVNTVKLS